MECHAAHVLCFKVNPTDVLDLKALHMYGIYLCCLPAPLPIFGIVGEPPHVPVGLDDLRSQDVVLLILPYSHRLQAAVELKGLRAELQHLREEEKSGGQKEQRRRNNER